MRTEGALSGRDGGTTERSARRVSRSLYCLTLGVVVRCSQTYILVEQWGR
jgi:hypothetical protein